MNPHLRSGQITFGERPSDGRTTFETRENMLEGFFLWAKGAGSRKIYYRLTKGLFFKGVVQEGMSQYYNPEK